MRTFLATSLRSAGCISLMLIGGHALAASPPPAGYTRVAVEGGSFTISGAARDVRYGLRQNWVQKTVSGTAPCSNAFFGSDPLKGVGKECWAAPAGSTTPPPVSPPPSSWKKIADEGGSFTLSSAQPVRYGLNSSWVEKTVNGAGQCTNAFFGRDPLVGVGKQCWSPNGTTPPPTNPPPTNPPPSTGGDFHPSGYSLTFNDEFDGSQLNRINWCTRYIYGGGPGLQVADAECQRNGDGTLDFLNDEQQRYVDNNRSGEIMHVVSNGVLTMRATKTRTTDSYASYESAMIRTKKAWQPSSTTSYYLTTRVKLPNVIGTWPAFWLNGERKSDGSTDWPPEIDIFEGALNGRDDRQEMIRQGSQVKGKQTASGHQEITFSAPEFDRTWDNYIANRSLRGVWIEIGAEWTANNVCYFVDGYKTMCENYKWVNNAGSTTPNATVLLNLAIGGNWAGRYGIDDAKFPTNLQVDYVRVYRKGG
jgi:beta-glucanase (GH16 family)